MTQQSSSRVYIHLFVVVQPLSPGGLFTTPWTAACQAPLEFAQIHVQWVGMLSNHLILCCPLLILAPIFPSIRVFSKEFVLGIRWPKYWSFSFSISPSNEYSGLISFRTDWLDLLAVQGTPKCLLQHHNLKVSILQHSAFFMATLSHLHRTTGKNSFDYMDFCQTFVSF